MIPTYTKFIVKTKEDKNKTQKFFRQSFNGFGKEVITLSTDSTTAMKFNSKEAAEIAAMKYIDCHKSINIDDLQIVRIQVSTQELDVWEIGK